MRCDVCGVVVAHLTNTGRGLACDVCLERHRCAICGKLILGPYFAGVCEDCDAAS